MICAAKRQKACSPRAFGISSLQPYATNYVPVARPVPLPPESSLPIDVKENQVMVNGRPSIWQHPIARPKNNNMIEWRCETPEVTLAYHI